MKKYTSFANLQKEVLLDGEVLGSALGCWTSLSQFTGDMSTLLNEGTRKPHRLWAQLPTGICSKIVDDYTGMTAEFQNKINKAVTKGRAGAAILLFLSKIGVYRFALVTTDDMNEVVTKSHPTGEY